MTTEPRTVEPTTEHHDSPDGVATSALDGLAAKLREALVRPADPEYDSIRAVFNGMIDRRPQAVVRCAGQSATEPVVGLVGSTSKEYRSCPNSIWEPADGRKRPRDGGGWVGEDNRC